MRYYRPCRHVFSGYEETIRRFSNLLLTHLKMYADRILGEGRDGVNSERSNTRVFMRSMSAPLGEFRFIKPVSAPGTTNIHTTLISSKTLTQRSRTHCAVSRNHKYFLLLSDASKLQTRY